MKRFPIFVALLLFASSTFASNLVLLKVKNFNATKDLISNSNLHVNFYNNHFVIATAMAELKGDYVVLDSDAWKGNDSYYLVYCNSNIDKSLYVNSIKQTALILYDGGNFLIVKTNETKYGQLQPAKNDGMVRIFNQNVTLPNASIPLQITRSEPNPIVIGYLAEISGPNITATVQHLQNYGTRDCYTLQSVMAQNWIKEQFEALGLSVQLQDFTMPSGSASDNVIATMVGTKYPNEFIVVGGHYDSRCSGATAPGADDNASGTAAVLEIARILSQYEFDRSIIFCAFSGEEYGLYGSSAFAQQCSQEGKDILGYFNLDMISYLKPGNSPSTTLIYPQSAQELATFYTTVCSIYLPAFPVTTGSLSGGDSDHTSFNLNGYMGIFPFEDIDNYSPYIHTVNDVVGTSYNSESLAVTFTKASLASVVTMANLVTPPRNLVAIPGNGMVTLEWNELVGIEHINVYRNGELIATTTNNFYNDFNVENGTVYEYFVTATFYESSEESVQSNLVTAIPMAPVNLPYSENFENGTTNWAFTGNWGLTNASYYSAAHSLSESPTGEYANNEESYATLNPINLEGYTSASFSFWTKYSIENNYDYVWVEVSTNNSSWTKLERFTGNQSSWTQKTYSLNGYLNQPYIRIRFHFKSDYSLTYDGIYIDNFSINVEGGYPTQTLSLASGWSGISSYIVPVHAEMEYVLSPITTDIVVVDDLVNTYLPSQNSNTIGNWNTNSGYIVKCTDNSVLNIAGNASTNKTIELTAGWNLMPVLSSCEVSCDNLLASVSEVEIVKEIAGANVYWPSQGIASLQNLIPGKAYMVKVNSNVSLSFPACTKANTIAPQKLNSTASFNPVLATPHSHSISFPSEVIQALEPGDIIAAFTPSGLCCGAVEITNLTENFALVAYANDAYTPEIDGFNQDDVLVFKLYRSSTNEYFTISPQFHEYMPNLGLFTNEGMSRVSQLSLVLGESENFVEEVSVFPNPTSSRVTVRLPIGTTAKLEIVNPSGQVVFYSIIEGEEFVNVSQFPSGVYIFRIHSNRFIETKKIIINRY